MKPQCKTCKCWMNHWCVIKQVYTAEDHTCDRFLQKQEEGKDEVVETQVRSVVSDREHDLIEALRRLEREVRRAADKGMKETVWVRAARNHARTLLERIGYPSED